MAMNLTENDKVAIQKIVKGGGQWIGLMGEFGEMLYPENKGERARRTIQGLALAGGKVASRLVTMGMISHRLDQELHHVFTVTGKGYDSVRKIL